MITYETLLHFIKYLMDVQLNIIHYYIMFYEFGRKPKIYFTYDLLWSYYVFFVWGIPLLSK